MKRLYDEDDILITEEEYEAKHKKPKSKEEKIKDKKGSAQSQLDYIVKNGLEAYITDMNRIESEE